MEKTTQARIKTKESAVHGARQKGPPASQAKTDLPQIRTREPVSHGITINGEPAPRVRSKPQVRTREATVHDAYTAIEQAPQLKPERPQIKTREATTGETITGISPDNSAAPAPDRRRGQSGQPFVKTKEAYIPKQSTAPPELPPQAFVQGRQAFIQERSQTAVRKQVEVQHTDPSAAVQAKGGREAVPPTPARLNCTGGQGRHTPAQAMRRPASPGIPDTQPMQKGGRAVIKASRSGRKTAERTARQTIKTADHSSRKAVKTTQRTVKTAQRAIKTAQKSAQATATTAKAAQRGAYAAEKVSAATKAAAKAAVAAVKAAIAALQALVAALGAVSLPVLLVVVVICLAGLIAASPFGIFFSLFFPGGGDTPDMIAPSAAVAQINGEYADRLSALQAGGSYDRVEIQGRPPAWTDVLAVFAAKTAGGTDGAQVAVLDPDAVEELRAVFWDMTKITTSEADVEHPAEGETEAWTERVLTITVTPRTPDDMRVFYSFTEEQNTALDALLDGENRAMWQELLYGSSGEIVSVALSQVGNVGGQPYWSWYGFHSREEWCACFVSWCANECGYIDAGVLPKFASCSIGSSWFKAQGQWQDGSYEPHPGDLIFFDWDNKGGSGPQDGAPDHVGIVERVENGVVYTVEGNSGDSCRQNTYSVGHYEIWGYATPHY